ncbi:MAG: hypothetical protein AB7N80_09310 [Bdellovibrionales bacterium]
MSRYFYITSPVGADIRPIRGDAQGQYLADPVHTAGQGSFYRVDGEIIARLSQGSTNSTSVVRLLDTNGQIMGVDASTGEHCSSGTLRIVSQQQSAADVEVLLAPSEEPRLEQRNNPVNLLVIERNSLIRNDFILLEIDGQEYDIVTILGLQGAQTILANRNDLVAVEFR